MKNRKISAFLFLILPFFCVSQSLESFNKYVKKYPNSDLVRLVNEVEIEITLENDQIKIKQTSVEEDLFLNESAFQHSKESVHYSSFYELEKIEAASFEIVNEEYIKQKVTEFKEKDELDGSFYDDLKSVNFRYPNLKKRGKSQLIITKNIKNPRFLSAFHFGGHYPVLNSKLTIVVDKKITLDFKEFNMEGSEVFFRKKEKRNKIIYTWEVENSEKIELEARTPNYRNYYPHIVPIIISYDNKNKETVKYLGGVKDLFNWYYSLVKEINKAPIDSVLEKLVLTLTEGEETELEKVRAIYYWVQDNIKYIANEYALGGFVPREANDVFNKKYGDCKDNSSILFKMLEAAGIKGSLTWIGTRDVPYKYKDLPTPAVDNHMILAYKNKNNTYLLDATGRFNPLELPSSFIQGKEALIGFGENDFEIYHVPVVAPEFNQEIDSTFIKVKEGSLIGNSVVTYSGYAKINLFFDLEPLTVKQTKDYYTAILRKGNNKFILNNFTEKNKYSYDQDYRVNYDFVLSDYIISHEDEMYIDLNFNKVILRSSLSEDRKTDYEIENKGISSFYVSFDIPQGYVVDYLPENVSTDIGFASSTISYSKKGNKIIYEHKLIADFLLLPKEKQEAYFKFVKTIKKAYKEVIVLRKIK